MSKAKTIILRLSYAGLTLCGMALVFAIAYKNIYEDDLVSQARPKWEYQGYSSRTAVVEVDSHKYVLAIRGNGIAIVHAASCRCSNAAR